MQESVAFFHQIEWPAAGARVAGPIGWVRGWVVGKPGYYFTEVRATGATGRHGGVLGFPRTDLAAHFKSPRNWLPAEFIIGVPLPDGSAEISIEACDEAGNWHRLQTLAFTVAADGIASPRVDGEVIAQPGGSVTQRTPHLPFHGHLDDPNAQPLGRDGQIELFGWLLHETQAVRAVYATLDGLAFNVLESGLFDDSLATKVPQHPTARHARLRGGVDAPPTLTMPAGLRVYAELADGSVQLCFARRIEARDAGAEASGHKAPATAKAFEDKKSSPLAKHSESIHAAPLLAPLPSGRPRRLLVVVRSLQPDDATQRALDVVRYLIASGRWAVRLIASEDGPLHATFEASECAVQLVDPRAYFAANKPAAMATARQALSREIWWKHLDGVVVFDAASTWASELAQAQCLPVFDDPAATLAWFAPTPLFTPDTSGRMVAPIRGLAVQGAGVLLQAAAQLARHPAAQVGERALIVTDNRDSAAEICLARSIALQPEFRLSAAQDEVPFAAAAVVCPSFAGHPHRALLSTLAAGVPLITTPSPLLSAVFGPNEINFVPSGNPLALAHTIIDVLANPAASNRRVAAAARLVRANFSPSAQLAHWERMLTTAIGR